jgi:hypothetical protein
MATGGGKITPRRDAKTPAPWWENRQVTASNFAEKAQYSKQTLAGTSRQTRT